MAASLFSKIQIDLSISIPKSLQHFFRLIHSQFAEHEIISTSVVKRATTFDYKITGPVILLKNVR